MIAWYQSPGYPALEAGTNEPLDAALFADSGATRPRMLPYQTLFLFVFWCKATFHTIAKESGDGRASTRKYASKKAKD